MHPHMTTKEHIVNQFKNRVFKESYSRIFTCLDMLDEEQIWSSPAGNIPSAGNLILHLCGNGRQWILSALGGYPDNRERDNEFIIHRNIKKSDLIFLLENLRVNMTEVLDYLDPEQLDRAYVIQGLQETGFSILVHVIEHFSYHTGQITTLAKLYSNESTDYYKGLDLNQLNNLN
jgi:uncharacterized damage-inducible protein DinB